MNRRDFLRDSVCATLLSSAALSEAVGQDVPRKPKPNLVFVFPDQFRVHAMGFMGADPVLTPNLDRFAAESIFFPNAVSNFPICSPFRAMLLTGQWPFTNGVTTNCNSGRPHVYLKPGARCFSDVLADAGYEAGYIGKYHLDTPSEEDAKYGEGRRGKGAVWDAYTPPGPRRHGFSFWHSYGCCDRHMKPHYWHGSAEVSQPTEIDEWSVKHETDVAVGFVRNADGRQRDPAKPFALFVAYNPPHPPYRQVPDEHRAPYRDRKVTELLNRPNVKLEGKGRNAAEAVDDYFAAVSGVDHHFGRILGAIEAAGQTDNTVVVFTADHGEMMGSHGLMGKGTYHDESLRIPLIIRYPHKLRPRHDPLHINVPDFMPTLLGLLGLRRRVPDSTQGTSFADYLLSGDGPRPTSTFYLTGSTSQRSGARGIRSNRYTFVVNMGRAPHLVLFDREKDPFQLRNIASEQPRVCQTLLQELNGWLASTNDPWVRIEWPVRPANAFAIHREGTDLRVDFEPYESADHTSAPTGDLAELTTVPTEVLTGARSLKVDTTASTKKYHEFMRLHDLLRPQRTYEVTYRYRVLAADEKTRFYTVVRSTADVNTKATRLYWNEAAGGPQTRSFRFETGAVSDHHLLFGVQYQGAICIDDVVVRELL